MVITVFISVRRSWGGFQVNDPDGVIAETGGGFHRTKVLLLVPGELDLPAICGRGFGVNPIER
jgi:hypothetical protein